MNRKQQHRDAIAAAKIGRKAHEVGASVMGLLRLAEARVSRALVLENNAINLTAEQFEDFIIAFCNGVQFTYETRGTEPAYIFYSKIAAVDNPNTVAEVQSEDGQHILVIYPKAMELAQYLNAPASAEMVRATTGKDMKLSNRELVTAIGVHESYHCFQVTNQKKKGKIFLKQQDVPETLNPREAYWFNEWEKDARPFVQWAVTELGLGQACRRYRA